MFSAVPVCLVLLFSFVARVERATSAGARRHRCPSFPCLTSYSLRRPSSVPPATRSSTSRSPSSPPVSTTSTCRSPTTNRRRSRRRRPTERRRRRWRRGRGLIGVRLSGDRPSVAAGRDASAPSHVRREPAVAICLRRATERRHTIPPTIPGGTGGKDGVNRPTFAGTLPSGSRDQRSAEEEVSGENTG